MGASSNQPVQGQPAGPQQPAVPQPYGTWPPPQPGTFREFGAQGGWPQRPPAGPPPGGYPQQPPAAGYPPGAPAPGYWQPGTPVPPMQGGFQGPPGQPQGFLPNQPPPPTRNTPVLFLALGGLLLLVILVPLVLVALSRPPSLTTTNNPQATTAPGSSTPAATPTAATGTFKPDGTAPTSDACTQLITIPCYSPEQMQQAFSLNSLYKQGYNGKGQTIVIIGAGNAPNIENDLKAFDKAWGLPDPPSFQIIQPFGPPTKYTCSDRIDSLELENTLDVEWSHAMAPGANIDLVIGPNQEQTYFPVPPNAPLCGLYDLEEAVNYALDHHLGNIVTISYGGSELGTDTDTSVDKANEQKEYDAGHAIFQKAVSMGVTVLSSSGDDGATNGNDYVNQNSFWNKPNVSWPASDPYVLAVGGTQLTIKDPAGDYGSEVAWNDNGGASGGGLSILYGEPAYQKTGPDQSLLQGHRGLPDVSFPADVNYLLYEKDDPTTIDISRWPHWNLIGGTSASSPCWAGLIAIADQISVQNGGAPLGYIHPGLYSLQGKYFHDITQGNNNDHHVAGYAAGPGYDLVTGWGTPIADQLLPALVQAVQQAGNTP
jgi:subtilase family serine protease